jgi:uncharacterized protein
MTENPNRIGGLRVLSHLLERAGLVKRVTGQGARRDMSEILNRKAVLTYKDFLGRYVRKDIAGRIVDAFPDATWRKAPVITEDDKPQDTAFEEALKSLDRRLGLFNYFKRVDRLAGLGRYAILVIGVKGGSGLDTALRYHQFTAASSIIYLSVFGEGSASIKTYETDPTSERFGKPLTYEIDFGGSVKGFTVDKKKQEVHWTRVIHVAEDMIEDEVHGTPRLERVFDLLEDLEKVVGGAAEMFWQGADRGLHADVREGFDGTLDERELQNLTDEITEYQMGLRRFLRTVGTDVKALGGTTADPTGSASVILDLIAGTIGIPKRILLGSERGELASTTDEASFFGSVEERRETFAEPAIIRATIDRLIWLGALPAPTRADDAYSVAWPSLFELADDKRLSMAKDAATINKLAPGTITEDELRTRYLGLEADTKGTVNEEKDAGKPSDLERIGRSVSDVAKRVAA